MQTRTDQSLGSQLLYVYGWVPSLSTWNYHNIINRLYPQCKMCLVLKS